MITVTCFGSRGSLPSPSCVARDFSTAEFGGNTSSYWVQAGPFSFILDMGSGVLALGDRLMQTGLGIGKTHICLLSHWHWDHIQGGPFFVPFFIPNNLMHFHGFAPAAMEGMVPLDRTVERLLSSQQVSPHFPVAHGSMPCRKVYHAHQRQFSETFWYVHDPETGCIRYSQEPPTDWDIVNDEPIPLPPERVVKVTTIPLNHPDGCLGYRIEYLSDVVVYATDDEPLLFQNKEILKHAKKARWLLLDGQYTPEQLAGMCQTFGHGTPRRCVETAFACEVETVVIHHHDPRHADAKLTAMELDAQDHARSLGFKGKVAFAREGATWSIGEPDTQDRR